MLLGEIVKQYRFANKLSLGEFAIMVGVSKTYISMLEKNYNPSTGKEIIPSAVTVFNCAKAMNISLDELIEQLDPDQLVHFPAVPGASMPSPRLTDQEEELLSKFRRLDDENQEEVMDYIDLRLAKYERSAKKDVESLG